MTFNDIYLIPPTISYIKSRADVNTSIDLCNQKLEIPIISSNMTAVYSPELAKKTAELGGRSCVHRFCTIQDNVRLFKEGWYNNPKTGVLIKPWCSIGVVDGEFERAQALVNAGCEVLVIDVAMGWNILVIEQYKRLRDAFGDTIKLVVGNFVTGEQINKFIEMTGSKPDAIKINMGLGSACLSSREVTGVGLPAIETITSCKEAGIPMIFDGGIPNESGLCKALALGCSAVFMGRQFSACCESGGQGVVYEKSLDSYYKIEMYEKGKIPTHKIYMGSASYDEYVNQKKVANYRSVEGEKSYIPTSGTVEQMLTKYQAGLRSSMSYMNSVNIEQFHKNVNWGKK